MNKSSYSHNDKKGFIMRTVVATSLLVSLVVTGCGVTNVVSKDNWSSWESNATMLPAGFPFPVRDQILEDGKLRFWTIDYDLNGDSEPELRVWYLLQKVEFLEKPEKYKMTIARNPHKVEKLGLSMHPVLAKNDAMLPAGFPFPVKDEVRRVGRQQFWIIDYDMNGDQDPDIRIWYFVKGTQRVKELDMTKMSIARNPHKVEKLRLGFFSVLSKIDFELIGKAQEIQEHRDGRVVTTWLE